MKHGCPSARVTCVISNAGALNYHKDTYGDKIIVVRTIQSQGGSSVKLLSERGELLFSVTVVLCIMKACKRIHVIYQLCHKYLGVINPFLFRESSL